jgi:hypothetical protein
LEFGAHLLERCLGQALGLFLSTFYSREVTVLQVIWHARGTA